MIVFTGTAGGFAEARSQLTQRGFANVEVPLIKMEAADSLESLERALGELDRYRAMAITSVRAAKIVAECCRRLGTAGPHLPVWCGPASVAHLAPFFPLIQTASSTGQQGLGLALAGEMLRQGVGSPVLFPCGESHREELSVRLRAAGKRVVPVEAYRTVLEPDATAAQVMTRADVVVVASPRVALHLARNSSIAWRPMVVAIGPTTARAARQAGLEPDAVALSPDADGLMAAVHTLAPSFS